VLGVLSGRNLQSGWSTQFWCFIGLFLVMLWRPLADRAALRRFAIAWGVATIALMGVQTAAQLFHVGGGARWATQFPGDQLAAAVTETWHRETGQPLAYVIGDFWFAGNVILFSRDRPSMFHEASLLYSPWIDPAELRRRGGILLWSTGISERTLPEEYRAQFPDAEPREPLELHQMTPRGIWTWRVAWAVLRPAAP
jgi:hypothetical protein